MPHRCLALITSICLASAAIAQTEDTPEPPPDGVEDAASAYIEGVLDGDAARVQAAAHELLAKRRVAREYWGRPSREWLKSITREQLPGLIEYLHVTGAVSPADGAPDIEILSWTPVAAAAKVQSGAGYQLLHLAFTGDDWIVVDDAYDLDPSPNEKSDEREIRRVVGAYARGIYERAPIKTLGACHTSLVKREVVHTDEGMMLSPMSYEEVELYVNAYNDYFQYEPRRARRDIEILDMTDSIASVRLDGENWTDLIHVAKTNDTWLIIDVLTTSH